MFWGRGERDRSDEHGAHAVALVEGRPLSPAQAEVFAGRARGVFLAGNHRGGLELAERALPMVEEVGRDDLVSHVLNTIGMARVSLGDPSGLDELRRSVTLAEAASSPENLHNALPALTKRSGSKSFSGSSTVRRVLSATERRLPSLLALVVGPEGLHQELARCGSLPPGDEDLQEVSRLPRAPLLEPDRLAVSLDAEPSERLDAHGDGGRLAEVPKEPCGAGRAHADAERAQLSLGPLRACARRFSRRQARQCELGRSFMNRISDCPPADQGFLKKSRLT